MVLITGANGRVGGLVAETLIAQGHRPRLLVRNPEPAIARFGSQADVVVGDLTDQVAVNDAMTGVDAVLLCSPVSPDQVQIQQGVVHAAEVSGAYIVKISGLGTVLDSYVDSGAWHARTEQQISESGLNYTFLRPYFFMQNLLFQLPVAREEGVLRGAVADARIAMVDVVDLAALAAALLLNPDLAPRQGLAVTEDRARNYDEVASAIGEVMGQRVVYERQTDAQVEENLQAGKMADWHVALLLQFNRAFRDGLGASVHETIPRLLGRPAISLSEMLNREVSQSVIGENPFPS